MTRITWIPDQVGYDKNQVVYDDKPQRHLQPQPQPQPQPVLVHHHRLLGQAGVALERVFDFFLGGGVLLPRLDLLLEHFGPRAVQIDLFARAFVHDFETMTLQQGLLVTGAGSAGALASTCITAKVSDSYNRFMRSFSLNLC